jgi:cytochrome c5
MKYTIAILVASIIIWGCNKKMTPAAPAAPVVNVDSINNAKIAAEAKAAKMIKMGGATFTAKCGRCHELKKVDNYSVSDWEPILASMAIKAKLDETEKANVLAYVNANARK